MVRLQLLHIHTHTYILHIHHTIHIHTDFHVQTVSYTRTQFHIHFQVFDCFSITREKNELKRRAILQNYSTRLGRQYVIGK